MRSVSLCLFTSVFLSSISASHAAPRFNRIAKRDVSQTALLAAVQSGLAEFGPYLDTYPISKLASAIYDLPLQALVPASTPIMKAFTAAALAADQADAATINRAYTCVMVILGNGGLPAGDVCVGAGGRTMETYSVAFNTVLEQFVGIVPTSTLAAIQAPMNVFFASSGFAPPIKTLYAQSAESIASATASLGPNIVNAGSAIQNCFIAGISSSNLAGTVACHATSNNAMSSYNNIFAGIVTQFAAIIPAQTLNSVTNIYQYYFSNTGTVAGFNLVQVIMPSISSMGNELAGNSATALLILNGCFSFALMAGSVGQTAPVCRLAGNQAGLTLQGNVNNILAQSFGILPPTIVLGLQRALAPLLLSGSNPTANQIQQAYNVAFDTASLGPQFASCVGGVEDCLTNALLGTNRYCNVLNACSFSLPIAVPVPALGGLHL